MSMTFVLVKGPMWLPLRDVYKRDECSVSCVRFWCMRNLSYPCVYPVKCCLMIDVYYEL